MFTLPVFACLCLSSIISNSGFVSAGYAANDYALHFPNHEVTDYANIWGMRSLTHFTLCFWMKSNSTGGDFGLFSYAVPGEANELLIWLSTDFQLCISGECRETRKSANDGKWHHICVSWQSSDGAWKLYKDGIVDMHSRDFKNGSTIKAGGSLVLGQDQDSLGGGFSSKQSFQGSLTNVNVWSYVLPADAIKSLSNSCLSGAGDVYQWSDFRFGVRGGTRVVIPSPCTRG